MSQILGLKFRDDGQVYYFASDDYVVRIDDYVIVTTEEGMRLGRVVLMRDEAFQTASLQKLNRIYRLADKEDVKKLGQNKTLAREAFEHCRHCIYSRQMDMKLVDVEVFFDRSKIVFYFTASDRVDFRELVKDLVKTYRTRIELRQIGVRHATQMVGAIGNCGLVCCCRVFLRKFAPVSIKMAKEQNLFLNPSKISGVCGRLLCCLSYEQESYEYFYRQCPKAGKKFSTDEGRYKVLRTNAFRKTIVVVNDIGEERELSVENWLNLNPHLLAQEWPKHGETLTTAEIQAAAALPAKPFVETSTGATLLAGHSLIPPSYNLNLALHNAPEMLQLPVDYTYSMVEAMQQQGEGWNNHEDASSQQEESIEENNRRGEAARSKRDHLHQPESGPGNNSLNHYKRLKTTAK